MKRPASQRAPTRPPAAEKQPDGAGAMVDSFVRHVRDLPQVRQVLVDWSLRFPVIYTVIEAEPFNDAQRTPIYDAQLEMMDAYPNVAVGWHVMNPAEYAGGSLDDILPDDLEVRLPQGIGESASARKPARRGVEAFRRAAERQARTIDAFVDRFVSLVRDLPQVRQVLVNWHEPVPQIYTVIEAEPMDFEPREPLYDAELAALDAYPCIHVDWHVMNPAEYPEGTIENVLSPDLEVRFAR